MKSILLPTDFSKNSFNAINYAAELFKNEVCEFYIINIQKASSFVSDDLMTMTSSATIYHTLIDIAKKSISNVINELKETYNNDLHEFYSIVDYDNFVDGINQACVTRNIDLIIMGTKGASGAEKVLFGSNTARVMQRCNTPVLAIPDGCKFNGLNNRFGITQSWSETVEYLSGSITTLHDSQEEFYNGELSGSHIVVSTQNLNVGCNPYKKINPRAIEYDGVRIYSGSEYNFGEFINNNNHPTNGYVSMWYQEAGDPSLPVPPVDQ